MTNYIFSSTNGVIIPDTADIKTTVQNEVTEAFQDLGQISLEDATPQGRFIDVETNSRASVISFNAEIANVLINISLAQGIALDAWGANFNVPRIGASASKVPVIAGGVENTIIPAGSQAIDTNGVIWTAENEILLGSSGTGTGTFVCTQTGPVSIAAGELNKIVASSTLGVDGWETITNTAIATLGANVESDAAYKLRILQSIYSGTALFGNYASACYKVDGVTDVYAYDNPHGSSRQLDNISIPAHSVYVCVDGGNAADVASALYTIKSAGCGWAGNNTVNVIDPVFGTLNVVEYQTPAATNISMTVNLTDMYNASTDLAEEVKEVIAAYFNNQYENLGYAKIGIRPLIDPFIIATLLQSQISGVSVASVQVGLKTPATRATATIIKGSVTSGITWASVTAATFGTQILTGGRYNFVYDGSDWKLNSSTVDIADYGITVTGTPVEGDTISVLFSTGAVSGIPIQLYASEKAVIDTEDITVVING